MHREIGSLIKELRLNRGMTLKELGQKANLSVSYLSTLNVVCVQPLLLHFRIYRGHWKWIVVH